MRHKADFHLLVYSMDIDYSPTGQEIVTGSYDRTLRLFDVRRGHSRDAYHTKRMQRYHLMGRNGSGT